MEPPTNGAAIPLIRAVMEADPRAMFRILVGLSSAVNTYIPQNPVAAAPLPTMAKAVATVWSSKKNFCY